MSVDLMPTDFHISTVISWAQYLMGPGSAGTLAGMIVLAFGFALFRSFVNNVVATVLRVVAGRGGGRVDTYSD